MEDDDIEYDITFPSPVSALDEDEDVAETGYIERKEPVVILLGWLGCQEKHISKYSQIYDQRGCITISYTAPKNVAFFNHWKLRDIACKVLDLLEDYYVQDNPILFHIFSNNGSYVYHSLVQVLAGGDKRNAFEVSNSLDPDQARHCVGPDLGPKILQRLLADDIRRQRVDIVRSLSAKIFTLLRAKAGGPLQTAEFLDLSNLGIVNIERFSACPKLQALNLRGNSIHEVSNLESNRHLWRLDLSNNKIQSIESLTKFVALGILNLANNDLNWQEVGKLRHLRILELSLHGNKQLEKDPYYRIHVIDCLPHIWMLDGRIVTSAERLQVKHFFADSALTEHPVRHKLSKDWFVPSSLKNIEVNGIYGEKATHLMMRFPSNGASNIESDRRRLKYLAFNAQEDLMVEKKATKREFQVLKYRKSFVEDILDIQPVDRERCNMLIVLLVATLEFVMPTHLVKETLETVKLSRLGKVYTMDLFLLPKDVRCRIVCILLGAVKVDKDAKEDGGLYDRLYLCLFYTVAELTKLCNSILIKNVVPKSKLSQTFLDYKCLLASEVVQLLCIVPAFFEYVDRDIGVMNLVVTATGDPAITDKIVKLSHNVLNAGGDVKKLYEELSDFLLQKVQEHSLNLTNRSHQIPREDQVFSSTKAFPMKSPRSPLDTSDYLAKGVSSPNRDPPSVLSARTMALKTRKHFPHLGDYLLLGPQTLGKVIGLPQPFVAHVAMDSIPVANGALESKLKASEDHYTYVNMDQMAWDIELGFWKPKGSIGDSILQEFLAYSNVASRFTIHTIEDLRKELNRRANLATDQIPRPNSPEDHMRIYTATPGRESTAPLIYSPGGFPPFSEELIEQKSKTKDSPPRPMSSYLKEKLDLKLDFNPRRAQSASAIDRPNNSPKSPKEQERPIKSADTKKSLPLTEEGSDTTGTLERVPSDCVHCAIEKGLASEDKSETDLSIETGAGEQQVETEKSETNKEVKKDDTEVAVPVDESAKVEEEVEDKGRLDTSRSVRTEFADDFEPELQNLETCRSENQVDVVQQPDINIKVFMNGNTTPQVNGNVKSAPNESTPLPHAKQPSSMLQINIPQADVVDTTSDKGGVGQRMKSPLMKGRRTPLSSRSASRPSKFVIDGRNRPFSAMDAYRYIIDHPRKTIARQGTPPPQRPSSPEGRKSRPVSALSIQKASNWLGGGRDLYWEAIQSRPKSGHIPGWKEGLPDSMKRPKSAVASRTLNRSSRRSTPVTPSSLAYDAMMQGSRGHSPRTSSRNTTTESPLPDLVDLSEYQPLYHHLGIPRRLGTAGSMGASDFQGQQTQDTVYSQPPSSPQMPALSSLLPRSPMCMQCILEDDDFSETGSSDSHS